MNRRTLLAAAGIGSVAALTWWGRDWLPLRGVRNPCLGPGLPGHLAEHPDVLSALDGLDMSKVWDCHVHLVGTGESNPEHVWVNPALGSLWHPFQFLQKRVYMNAACVDDAATGDELFIERLEALVDGGTVGRPMLLAFDYSYDDAGRRRADLSTFYVANAYTQGVTAAHPGWEWICSVHPYREDALEALQWAAAHGACAVKWLPPVMGMDPASPRCDPFYDELVRLDLPLLTHGGHELAAEGGDQQPYGDPRRLKRALEHGVRVIVAHAASLGTAVDIRKEASTETKLRNFRLFMQMMREPAFEDLLYGDLSAVAQVNRAPEALRTLLEAEDIHDRLLNGSDYPLTGVLPLFSLHQLERLGLLGERPARVLADLQAYNSLLFDLVLKRSLAWGGRRFPAQVFETASFFSTTG